MANDNVNAAGSSPLQIAIAWSIVGIPLAWGVYQTILKSLPLFK
jgi:hypothetical protein